MFSPGPSALLRSFRSSNCTEHLINNYAVPWVMWHWLWCLLSLQLVLP